MKSQIALRISEFVHLLIKTNIYISLAAVALTFETQILFGMKPQIHPYIFIIFFATLFEYNINRLINIYICKKLLNSDNYKYSQKNVNILLPIVITSVIGFICMSFFAKREVLVILIPLAFLTIFYSIPLLKNKKSIFNLREIPYLKIFLICIIWTLTTIMLPVIQSNMKYENSNLVLRIFERFFFIFAITIPFDIRDKEDDLKSGLKTIPIFIDESKSYLISYISISISFLLTILNSVLFYKYPNLWMILIALSISYILTFWFLYSQKIRKLNIYHYGILDGSMLLQGILVIAAYYL